MIKSIVIISMFVSATATATAQEYNWQQAYQHQQLLQQQRDMMQQQQQQHREQMQEMQRARWQRELDATYPLDNSRNLFKY